MKSSLIWAGDKKSLQIFFDNENKSKIFYSKEKALKALVDYTCDQVILGKASSKEDFESLQREILSTEEFPWSTEKNDESNIPVLDSLISKGMIDLFKEIGNFGMLGMLTTTKPEEFSGLFNTPTIMSVRSSVKKNGNYLYKRRNFYNVH